MRNERMIMNDEFEGTWKEKDVISLHLAGRTEVNHECFLSG
jgi:hypothetical protein